MYAITGITGRVGGVVAKSLLFAGEKVRAVVRDAAKGHTWAQQGCEVAVADLNDPSALVPAFADTEAVFVLIPPSFDPTGGFPEIRVLAAGLRKALVAAQPGRVVCISTIGAQAGQENLLGQLSLVENELSHLPMPVAFLRPAWFMENAEWDIAPAKEQGFISSYLQPVERKFPMVATADVGHMAAELLQQKWDGVRVVELEGPELVSPNDIAMTLTRILGREVTTRAVPREQWEDIFRGQGMRNPLPRMQMLDGFNEGWIRFENTPLRGKIGLEQVLRGLL